MLCDQRVQHNGARDGRDSDVSMYRGGSRIVLSEIRIRIDGGRLHASWPD
jgi:hypothetical protein